MCVVTHTHRSQVGVVDSLCALVAGHLGRNFGSDVGHLAACLGQIVVGDHVLAHNLEHFAVPHPLLQNLAAAGVVQHRPRGPLQEIVQNASGLPV